MKQVELEIKMIEYKEGKITLTEAMIAVDAYSSASNDGKPIISGSLPHSESPIELIERRFVTADGVIEWNEQFKGLLTNMLGGNDR